MRYLGKSFKIGVLFFAIGLFKKVVVADSLAPFANDIFSFAARPGYEISSNDAWLGALAYSLQLYFDFSGYSDMAIGLGRMFGFHLPLNFNSPYKARSIIDFWRRWHITLSSFFRTYVYYPLGGNRHGLVRQIACIVVVFFLTGLWHGAAWSFVVWGLAHGALVIINNLWNKATADFLRVITVEFPSFRKLYDFFAWCLTIFFVTLLWVLFRAESLEVALKIIDAMLHPWRSAGRVFPDSNVYFPLGIALIGLNLWCWIAPNTKELICFCRPSVFVQVRFVSVKGICLNFKPWVYACFVGVALYSALTSIGYVRSQFIYFNF